MAASGLGTAARIASKAAIKTLTKTLSRTEGPSAATTSQYDSRVLYRRKRAPKRVRRRAARRFKRHIQQQLKTQGDITNLFRYNGSFSSTANYQVMFTITSGYMVNNFGFPQTDAVGSVYQMVKNIENEPPEDNNMKRYLTRVTTDYTLVNDSEGIAELDVYEFVYRRRYVNDNNGNTGDAMSESLASEQILPGNNFKMEFRDLGTVPTDANTFMRYIVIKSKQRFYLGPGQATSFTKRVKYSKPLLISPEDLNFSDDTSYFSSAPGVTRGIICIAKGLPSATNAGCDPVTIRFNSQTRYGMKRLQLTYDKNGLGS